MAHDKSVLAASQQGEVRVVYARHKSTGDVVFMPDGEADALRELTRTQLVCIVPGCPTPRLKTMSRRNRRDGFAHHSGGGHDPGHVFHLQAQHALAAWLRRLFPLCKVKLEEASSKERERIADVMLTAPNGQRMAFEVQYASMTPEDFARRHESYVAKGIPDVWVFGHTGVHMRLSRTPERAAVSPVLEAVAAAGLPILWFNPITDQVGVGTSLGFAQDMVREVLATKRGEARVRIEPLNMFTLDGLQLTSPGLRFLRENEANLAERRAQGSARQASPASMPDPAAVQHARDIAAAKAEEARAARQKRLEAERGWEHSALYRTVMREVGDGDWPEFLNVMPRTGSIARTPQNLWQAALYLDFVHEAGAADIITRPILQRALAESGLASGMKRSALTDWMDVLVGNRTLTVQVVTPAAGRYPGVTWYRRREPNESFKTKCVKCRIPLPTTHNEVGVHVTCNTALWLLPNGYSG